MKVVLTSGGFDPLHSGHIALFNEAKKQGDILVVGINSNEWLARKKGQAFMDINDRLDIVKNLAVVDAAIVFDDSDGSACKAIEYCLDTYTDSEIIFVNGGDRTSENIPEMRIKSERLKFVFGVGGSHKMNSSSKILSEWKNPKTERKWGYYRVLHSDGPSTKVKELVVEPGKSLSLQQHDQRSEYWIVSYGKGKIIKGHDINSLQQYSLNKHDSIIISNHEWHQLINDSTDLLRIVEIQYGSNCIEEDIIRH
jgi:D-beta-D-heptose 7-phosphate kinase/D-beta-D-heptose 1-phosphate adenosyltransferase